MTDNFTSEQVLAMADRLAKLEVYGACRDGAAMLRAYAVLLSGRAESVRPMSLKERLGQNATLLNPPTSRIGRMQKRMDDDDSLTVAYMLGRRSAQPVAIDWYVENAMGKPVASVAKWEPVGFIADEPGGHFARFTEEGHKLPPGTPLYAAPTEGGE